MLLAEPAHWNEDARANEFSRTSFGFDCDRDREARQRQRVFVAFLRDGRQTETEPKHSINQGRRIANKFPSLSTVRGKAQQEAAQLLVRVASVTGSGSVIYLFSQFGSSINHHSNTVGHWQNVHENIIIIIIIIISER